MSSTLTDTHYLFGCSLEEQRWSMEDEVCGVREVLGGAPAQGAAGQDKLPQGDIGDVTFCMANYVKEAMKVNNQTYVGGCWDPAKEISSSGSFE